MNLPSNRFKDMTQKHVQIFTLSELRAHNEDRSEMLIYFSASNQQPRGSYLRLCAHRAEQWPEEFIGETWPNDEFHC
jgi:hypothetical protein